MTAIDRTNIKSALSAATRVMLNRHADCYNTLYAAAECLAANSIGLAKSHIRDITGQCMGGAPKERHQLARDLMLKDLRAGLGL